MERGVSSSGAAPNGSFDRMESSYYSNTNVIRIKKKNSFTKSFFVTPLLVSQKLNYYTKVEKLCFLQTSVKYDIILLDTKVSLYCHGI
jgi:hypothetical protein